MNATNKNKRIELLKKTITMFFPDGANIKQKLGNTKGYFFKTKLSRSRS